jgi:predicted DNA-binding WGR domain protein
MKRYFINQDGFSNKFWNVEIYGKTQIITFGKINTQGRKAEKEFETAEECQKETEKLISQKLKKGYVEIFDEKDIPEKTPLSDDEAGELFFWNSIEKSNKHRYSDLGEYDIEEHLENLTELLSKSGKQKLIQFEKCLQQNLQKLYTAEIAELYIILTNDFKTENGQIVFDDYISEDGFIYFRCWLLLQGKEFFDDITKDINSLISGKYGFNIADTWAEGLLYVADKAYLINHESEEEFVISDAVAEMYPEVIHYDSREREMNREPARSAKLQKLYPDLVEEITKLKS